MNLCHCGKEKSRTAPACNECMWLDGTTASETRIIDALRMAVSPIDVKQLASLCDTTERSVLRSVKPLLATGRVLKREGPPTLYRLGTKRKTMTKKRQGELEGFERPGIEEIDDAIAELADAEMHFKEWKKRKSEAQASVDRAMLRNEKSLELNSKGERVYVYRDGEIEHTSILPPNEYRRIAKVTSKHVPAGVGDGE